MRRTCAKTLRRQGARAFKCGDGLVELLPARLSQAQVKPGSIVRSRWAWQFTRAWSLRFIAQYDATHVDPLLTAISRRRNLNADVLLTRLINPWTALYVGYNGNAQNIALDEAGPTRTLRRTDALKMDGWQVFAKWSHLLQW